MHKKLVVVLIMSNFMLTFAMRYIILISEGEETRLYGYEYIF